MDSWVRRVAGSRGWVGGSLLAGVVVFCAVQDRVTAAGARRYVALQREALAGNGRLVTIEEAMGPAVERSVRLASLAGGAVVAAGVALGARRRRR